MNSAKILEFLFRRFEDKDNKNFNALDFVYKYGSPASALLYSKLFWPDFIEIDDMVFMKSDFEEEEDYERLNQAKTKYNNRQETEKSFNFHEIPQMFSKRDDTTDDEDYLLAQVLKETWAARLSRLFPDKEIVVEITEPEDSDELGLIFYQA